MTPFLVWCLCVGIGSALLVGMIYRDRITDVMNQGARLSTRIGSLEAKLEKRPDSVQQTQYAVLEETLRRQAARITGLEGDVAKLQSRKLRTRGL